MSGCVFDLAWRGPCGAPAVTASYLCETHAKMMCVCGQQAFAECDVAGSLVCGRPVCAQLGRTCVHHGGRHERSEDDRVDFKVEGLAQAIAENLPPTRHVVESTTPGRLGAGGARIALDAALLRGAFAPQAAPAPRPRPCRVCGGTVRWVECPTGGWWAHDVHPEDEHDAEVVSAQDAVIADLEARKAVGLARYGTLLYPFNGRDMLRDAYEEALDMCVYLRALMDEREALDEDR